MTDDDNVARRTEEAEALTSFYDDDFLAHVDTDGDQASPEAGPSPALLANGPWRIRVAPKVVLEMRLPPDYPSEAAPVPYLRAPHYALDEGRRSDLLAELRDMALPDSEVAILWAEHCKAELADIDAGIDVGGEDGQGEVDDGEASVDEDGTLTFVPATGKFGQPIRTFEAATIASESNRRPIHRGQRLHPPRSGPSEIMQAHVAKVTSMDHVNWVTGELLLNDKKVSKASHNMIAYRFFDKERDCIVSDNDDDGEKGSGTKLAALLEMSDALDVVVVVSRWYGGIHLGPKRFRYIAQTARNALEEAGFIGNKDDGDDDGNADGRRGRNKGRK